MRKTLLLALFLLAGMGQWVMAQGNRYLSEVFADSQITVTSNVVYGQNNHFFPPTTTYPVANLTMRVYQPSQAVDANQARPVMVYIHTGNFLPPVINGGITGSIDDSSAVNLCRQWAKRGYVVIAPKYRLGWNPLAATQLERTAQLLNAVYRAINDIKSSVRFMRKTVAIDGNPYKIDQSKIALFGVGSGGYVAIAYATMNQWAEVSLPKFQLPNGQSVIDSNIVGNLDGFGGLLNQNNWPGYSSAVNMAINVGGAMADTSWLDGGEVPMVSFQAVRDPFAPYRQGIVVVPTTNENVVEVQGAGIFQALVNAYGNNAPFADVNKFRDPVSNVARGNYNQTIPYIYPAPNDQINTGSGEGLWPIIRPVRNLPLGPGGSITTFFNETDPYTWWDSTTLTFVVAATNAQTGGTYNAQSLHQQGLLGNPGMSRIKGLTFIDTIQQYIHPRIVHSLNLATNVTFRVNMAGLTVNSAGMHIAGNFQGWNPGSTAMTQDPNNANIWTYTTKLTPGDNLEFKFINGNAWGNDEAIPSACAVGGNRGYTVTSNGNDTLPLYFFGSCQSGLVPLQSVTFQVDMTGLTVSSSGVRIAGSFQGWNPAGTPMTPAAHNGNIYTYTTNLPLGDVVEWKYINGNSWGSEEFVPGACAINGQGGGNRSHTVVAGNNILSPVMFGSCSVFTPVPVNVTFMLSMQGLTVSPNGVHIAGSFQGWNPSTSALTQDPQNPSVWSYTHNGLMSGDTIYYKFINGNAWGNDESVSGSCAFPGSNNRYLIVPLVNSTLGLVGFGSCSASNPIITFRVNMTGLTIDSAGVGIAGTLNGWNPASTRMTQDPTDPNIWTYSTPLATGTTVLYKFINGAAWGRDELLADSTCGQPNGFGSYNRRYVVPALPTTLPAVAFGSCNLPPVMVSGRFTYNNTAMTPMTNSVVMLMNGTTVVASDSTDALGDFSISAQAGSYTLTGATSKAWGGVTASDALLATRHVVGTVIQTGLRLKACDVNNSNSVTSGDALLINRRFAGSLTSFNVGNFAYGSPAVTVGSANVTQNLQAICYGDINGSYTPNVNTRNSTVALVDAGLVNGDILAVSSDRNLELGSVSLVLNIPAGVTVRDVRSKLHGGQLDYQISGNQVRLGWYNTEGMTVVAGQELVELVLSSSRNVNASEWILGSETELTDVWAEAYSGAALRIPSLKANASTLSIYPNPVVNHLGIRLPLQASAKVQVEVLDATGRVVSFNAFDASAGEFAQQISLEGLAKGQYMIRVIEQGAQGQVLHNARFVR